MVKSDTFKGWNGDLQLGEKKVTAWITWHWVFGFDFWATEQPLLFCGLNGESVAWIVIIDILYKQSSPKQSGGCFM